MKKCKVCGQLFEYHVSNAHIETHDLTRKEYNELPGREDNFIIGAKPFSKKEDDIDDYVHRTVEKNRHRSGLSYKAR